MRDFEASSVARHTYSKIPFLPNMTSDRVMRYFTEKRGEKSCLTLLHSLPVVSARDTSLGDNTVGNVWLGVLRVKVWQPHFSLQDAQKWRISLARFCRTWQ